MTLSMRHFTARKRAFSCEDIMQDFEDNHALLDSSLTSLGWLLNLRVLDLLPDVVPLSPSSEDDSAWDSASSASKSPDDKKRHSKDRSVGIALSPIRKCLLQSAEFRATPRKYRTRAEKPPFSYSTLIYLAIQHSKSDQVTLNEIYRWIKGNFKYYKHADPGWQVSQTRGMCGCSLAFHRHSAACMNLFLKM